MADNGKRRCNRVSQNRSDTQWAYLLNDDRREQVHPLPPRYHYGRRKGVALGGDIGILATLKGFGLGPRGPLIVDAGMPVVAMLIIGQSSNMS